METKERSKIGKKSRAAGKRFEDKVYENLSKDYLVIRFDHNVSEVYESDIGEYSRRFQKAKAKWNPVTKRPMSISTGFPDYICINKSNLSDICFVECKMNGELDRIEKQKVQWLREKFDIPFLIASKGKKRGEITYTRYRFMEINNA